MKYTRGRGAFTLAELMVSMSASTVVLGALMLSSLSLQKALNGSEKYAGAYSDQRRVIDYVARDLRRAVAVKATNDTGLAIPAANQTITIADRATITFSLPGYYKNNTKYNPDYDQALAVVGTEERLDYGTSAGLASPVNVTYRKVYFSPERCVCFVRQEAGADEVIVRQADNLYVQVTVQANAQSATINAWFRAPYSGAAPLVSTYDRLLLRNPPLDFKP